MIKKAFPIIIILLLLSILSCDLFTPANIPEAPEWYPNIIQYSEELTSEINPYLSIFSNRNRRDDSRLYFDSTRNIYSDIDQIDIELCSGPVPFDNPDTLINYVENTLNDWKRMISVEAIEFDSCRIALSAGEEKLVRFYPEITYNNPVYNPISSLGRIQLKITDSGRIIDISSTLIPQYPVPSTPNLSLSQAKSIISGYKYQTFGLYGISDHRFSLLTMESFGLEIFINYYSDRSKISYHLAWRFTNFDGHFFVDAMTGEVLYFYQQWRN